MDVRPVNVTGAAAGSDSVRSVKVLAHLDGTDPVADTLLSPRLRELERVKHEAMDTFEAAAQVYRNPLPAAVKISAGIGMLLTSVAPPVVMALLGPVGMALGAAYAAVATLKGLPIEGLRHLVSGLRSRGEDDAWRGKRVYESIAPNPGDSAETERVNGSLLNEISPRPQEYADFLVKNLDPAACNIAYFAGHGQGYRSIASLKTREIAQAAEAARQARGKALDVIMVEACLAGNWEAVSDLRGAARYAIVSEEVMRGGRFPMQKILVDAARETGSVEDVARRMFDTASQTVTNQPGDNKTLSLIDLQKVDSLNDAMARLGGRLMEELRNGRQADIRNAQQAALQLPSIAGGALVARKSRTNLADLGDFIDSLQRLSLASDTQAALAAARQAVQEVVVAKVNDDRHQACSGLSYQPRVYSGRGSGLRQERYDEADVPAEWKDFIRALWA